MTKPFKNDSRKNKEKMRKMFINATRHPPASPLHPRGPAPRAAGGASEKDI